jgi:hypothetical protein
MEQIHSQTLPPRPRTNSSCGLPKVVARTFWVYLAVAQTLPDTSSMLWERLRKWCIQKPHLESLDLLSPSKDSPRHLLQEGKCLRLFARELRKGRANSISLLCHQNSHANEQKSNSIPQGKRPRRKCNFLHREPSTTHQFPLFRPTKVLNETLFHLGHNLRCFIKTKCGA